MKTWIIILSQFILVLFSCNKNKVSGTPIDKVLLNSVQTNLLKDDDDTLSFNINTFTAFPVNFNKLSVCNLLGKITPDTTYKYWECFGKCHSLESKCRVKIYSFGDSILYSAYARSYESFDGFLYGKFNYFFSYIVGVRNERKVILVDSKEKFHRFIGHIDNIEEVILISMINGFAYTTDTIIGGAYKERKDDYLLYLLEYHSSPISYTSVKAVLKKDGSFVVLEKNKYLVTTIYVDEN